MKNCFWGLTALALVAVGSARAADIEYKPIDPDKYLVRPTKATAGLVERSINAIGQTTSNGIKGNGYVKTINNLFSKKIYVPHTQTGPSALPAPTMFRSTRYKNYNTPVMPISQPRR